MKSCGLFFFIIIISDVTSIVTEINNATPSEGTTTSADVTSAAAADTTTTLNSPTTHDDCFRSCSTEYEPLCGSDGVTYNNTCYFVMGKCRNSSLEIIFNWECDDVGPDVELHEENCEGICPKVIMPVCGSNGATYPNLCVFRHAKCRDPTLYQLYDGKCVEEVKVEEEPIKTPVSTTAANTDTTSTSATSTTTTVATAAAAADDDDDDDDDITLTINWPTTHDECSKTCSRVLNPICGSDGVTYANLCVFQNEQCRNSSLQLIGNFDCDSMDSNGNDYSDICPSGDSFESLCSKVYKWECYDNMINRLCCKTCYLKYFDGSNPWSGTVCPYGNRAVFCNLVTANDCLSDTEVGEICCATCPKLVWGS